MAEDRSGGVPRRPGEDRLPELRRLIEAEVAHPDLARSRVSLAVLSLSVAQGSSSEGARRGSAESGSPVPSSQPAAAAVSRELAVGIEPDAKRVPASNAKLLTTTAAALLLPGKYRFVTEVSSTESRGPLYLWGTGDPVLRRADLVRLAHAVRGHGVRAVRGVVVDDSHFRGERMAPGFESFATGAYYRPISGAINVDSNAIVIQVSAPADRRRPRVDVTPPSDHVVVRKLVRYAKAKRCPEACRAQIQVVMKPRGSTLWLTISGTMGRKAKPWTTRRAVVDPSLNAGWALRRALMEAGVKVSGTVRRGRRPEGARVIARREHALADVLAAANRDSDNLAAETLVRIMSFLPEETTDEAPRSASSKSAGGAWSRGLTHLRRALAAIGVSGYDLFNGSGLHRRSRVTARQMIALLSALYEHADLRQVLLPTLSVAGRTGTLAPRLRGTAAEGLVHAKTGTLGGALALSGYVDPGGQNPLAFSLLVNGRSDRVVRDHMDRIAALLARYARGMPLVEETPATQPTTQPANGTDAEEEETTPEPASPPSEFETRDGSTGEPSRSP
jgi:D-alanyl-D-alanine carboxypeptidase/D-alanyl-D-alanine-endopeptidase (penicillin-binding protein 4)